MHCSRRTLFTSTLLAAIPVLVIGATSLADDSCGTPRQYYSGWEQSPSSSYYYRNYYYKPSPSYAGYKHHYVVAYPADPKHLYFYNPYKKTYWGRCDAYSEGQPTYSRLPAEYQHGSLSEIPESAFPPAGQLPPIPESRDGGRLDLPPDDLPPNFGTAPGGAAAAAPAPKSP
jgi:hypothetical protein